MTLRNERVRKELMRDISEILQREIRGLAGVVSRSCRCCVSCGYRSCTR